MPTDLLGVTVANFSDRADGNVLAAIGPACNQIRRAINKLPTKSVSKDWLGFLNHVRELANKLRASPNRGGFSFDVLVGISRGGISVADLLARLFGGNIPVTCLWADRHSSYPQVKFDGNFSELNKAVLNGLSAAHFKNVLIVDDVTRSGATIQAARAFVESNSFAKIRTCVVYASAKSIGVDYYVAELGAIDRETPFSAVEKI
jgi:hypoxanthine phosphoribosyltransferase